MTPPESKTDPIDDDLLAAEYVLGTLPLADRARAEARLREPAFAAAVAAWELRLSGLNAEFDAAPAPDLLPRIEARLFPAPPRPRWHLPLWGLSTAATAALALWLALTPLAPPLTARIEGEGTRFAAFADASGLTIRREDGGSADPTHSHELWLIEGQAAPVSLGVLGTVTRVSRADLPEGAVLAISVEPLGGSKTGQPTGPVVAMGKLLRG